MLYLCHNRIDWRLNFDLFCTLSARAAEIGGNALPDTGRPPERRSAHDTVRSTVEQCRLRAMEGDRWRRD